MSRLSDSEKNTKRTPLPFDTSYNSNKFSSTLLPPSSDVPGGYHQAQNPNTKPLPKAKEEQEFELTLPCTAEEFFEHNQASQFANHAFKNLDILNAEDQLQKPSQPTKTERALPQQQREPLTKDAQSHDSHSQKRGHATLVTKKSKHQRVHQHQKKPVANNATPAQKPSAGQKAVAPASVPQNKPDAVQDAHPSSDAQQQSQTVQAHEHSSNPAAEQKKTTTQAKTKTSEHKKDTKPMPSFAQTKKAKEEQEREKRKVELAVFRRHGAPKGIPISSNKYLLNMIVQDKLDVNANEIMALEQDNIKEEQAKAQKAQEKLNQDLKQKEEELEKNKEAFFEAQKHHHAVLDPYTESIVNHSFQQPEEIRRKNATSSAVTSLIEMIEKLTHSTFLDEPMSDHDRMDELRELRRNEALTVAKELHEKAENYYDKYIHDLLEAGTLNRDYTFEKLTWDALNRTAFEKARLFLDNIEKNGLSNIIFIFSGNMGSGKTCLSHAIANAYFDNCRKVRRFPKFNKSHPFIEISTIEEIRSTWLFDREETIAQREERESNFKRYCEVDLLILDSLCPDGQALDSFSQKVLAELLHLRSIKKLPLVIGLGVSLESIEQRLGAKCIEQLKCFRLLPVYLQGGSRRSFRLLEEDPALDSQGHHPA